LFSGLTVLNVQAREGLRRAREAEKRKTLVTAVVVLAVYLEIINHALAALSKGQSSRNHHYPAKACQKRFINRLF